MEAGRLRHRITIQQSVPAGPAGSGRNEIGGVAETWTDLATVWAEVAPLQGREYLAAQQVRAEVTHRITIRYRPGITPKHRVVWGSRTFEIVAVIDPKERHEELQLMSVEEVTV